MNTTNSRKSIRRWIMFFMAALFCSGITAIPVEKELALLVTYFPFDGSIRNFLAEVQEGVNHAAINYPYLFYGYDWLAFAHFVLAILFIGPLRDPVRNKWVIEFGIIACIMIVPYALVAGHIRGIPVWWRIIDCSFGIIGLIPLAICRDRIGKLEKQEKEESLMQGNSYSMA